MGLTHCFRATLLLAIGGVYSQTVWDYSTQGANWPDTCASGNTQSPINLPAIASATTNAALNLQLTHYRGTDKVDTMDFDPTGHNLYIRPKKGTAAAFWGTVVSNGKLYNMGAVHFHAPSEHTITTTRHALEMHVVCELAVKPDISGPDDYLVLGVMFTEGASSPLIQEVLKHIPQNDAVDSITGTLVGTFLTAFHNTIDSTANVYRYSGSLTTPPCTEAVSWAVFDTVQTATKAQLDSITGSLLPTESVGTLKGNYRVLQTNALTVQKSSLVKAGGMVMTPKLGVLGLALFLTQLL